MFTPDSHELAWAAGFYDGEGCTSTGTEGRVRISISQTHPEVLERFVRAVGVGAVGGPYLPPSAKRKNYSDVWVFRTGGFEKSQAVIAMLWPWLGKVKRDQAASMFARDLGKGSRSLAYGRSLEDVKAMPYVCAHGHRDRVTVTRNARQIQRTCKECGRLRSATRRRERVG